MYYKIQSKRGNAMDNCRAVFNECSYLVDKYDDKYRSVDEGGYIVETMIKDLGNIKLCLSELFMNGVSEFFYVFYIVETSDLKRKIDFLDNFWKRTSPIKKMIKISGNFQSIVITSYLSCDGIDIEHTPINRILIHSDKEMATNYSLTTGTSSLISVDNIINSIETLDINKFFSNSNIKSSSNDLSIIKSKK